MVHSPDPGQPVDELTEGEIVRVGTTHGEHIPWQSGFWVSQGYTQTLAGVAPTDARQELEDAYDDLSIKSHQLESERSYVERYGVGEDGGFGMRFDVGETVRDIYAGDRDAIQLDFGCIQLD